MKRLLLLAFCSVLSSCDPYSEARLCNDSSTDLQITIRIDREFVKENWPGDQSVRFLKEFVDSNELIELTIDTVSLQGVYKLERGKCSILYEGISSTPRFMFNYLKVDYRDTSIVYGTVNDIEQAFLVSDRGKHELAIKD